jgi:hypothetical protein
VLGLEVQPTEVKPMTSQSQNPNQPKSAPKPGQPPPQSQQAQDAHTNSSRSGERLDPSRDRSDPNRKASTQHGGGQQQGNDPSRVGK